MIQIYNIIIIYLIILNIAKAQNEDELKKYGFINIATDSLDVPFFVDGFYVGNHPLRDQFRFYLVSMK